MYAQYAFASFWKVGFSGNINYRFGDIDDVFSGNILMNPSLFRSMQPDNLIVQTREQTSAVRLEYRNPLNNIFFNTRYRLGWSTENLTTRIVTEGLATSRIEYIEHDYNTNNRSFSEIGRAHV